MYGSVWLCMSIKGYVGLFMAMKGYERLCMAMHGNVGLVRLCTAM